MTTSPEAANFAKMLADMQGRLDRLERASHLSNASIEATSIPTFDADGTLRQVLGLQDDGTYTVVDANGPPPPVPSAPLVEEQVGGLTITWIGTFVGAAIAPADFDHVEVHVSIDDGFEPTDDNQVTTFKSRKGESVTVSLPSVAHYVVLQTVSTSGTESGPSAHVQGTPEPIPEGGGGSDGEPPPPVADVEVVGGIKSLFVGWPAVENADPVTYDVHASTQSGFTPNDATTLIGSVDGTLFVVRRVWSVADGALADPSPTSLSYVRVLANDPDGPAGAYSPEASGTAIRVNTPDIEPFAVTTGTVADFALPASKFHTLTHVIY